MSVTAAFETANSGLSKSYDYVAPFRPPKVNKEPYVEVEMPPQQMVVEALGKHTATVIFSHGLGDTARGWYPVAKELQSRFRHIKWILPTAPIDRVTLNAGMSMNSWFDIKTLMPPSPGVPTDEDEAGMLKSVSRIQQIIADEVDAGIDASRIVVGGFSQGACISILTGLTSERKLAGIVSLSGWLGLSDKAKSMATDHAHKLPILWGHGNADNIVRYSWGSDSIKALQKMGFKDIDFHTYPGMGHSFCDEEQDHLTAFIAKVLPEATSIFLAFVLVPILAAYLYSTAPKLPSPSTRSTPASPIVGMTAPLVIPATGKHTATVIMVHGLGDTGSGWLHFARHFAALFPHIKFVLPTAPTRVVSVAKQGMTAWFDVRKFGNSDPGLEDQEGMMESVGVVEELVGEEVRGGVREDRVVVGGFSQGCVVTLLTGLTTERKIAGVLGLSGFLGMADRIASNDKAKTLPIFWGHGTGDQMISITRAEAGVEQLRGQGLKNIEFKVYAGMPHSTCPEEIADVEAFLRKVLPE
ncbi:hypothetical protein MNV49_004074 [Pseudohyphozyma bogoriensis]|nr:hypothetical protein MNV49_004074 [Pseudohyphozyma bogoriensis]